MYIGFYTLLGYFYFYVRNALPHPFAVDPNTASGVCVLLFTIVGALGAAISAKPADRFDERAIVTFGGGILAVGIGVLAFAQLTDSHSDHDFGRGYRLGNFSLRGLGICVPVTSAGIARINDGDLESRDCRAADACANCRNHAVASNKHDRKCKRAPGSFHASVRRVNFRCSLDLAFTQASKLGIASDGSQHSRRLTTRETIERRGIRNTAYRSLRTYLAGTDDGKLWDTTVSGQSRFCITTIMCMSSPTCLSRVAFLRHS